MEETIKVKANHQIAYKNKGYAFGDVFEMKATDLSDYQGEVTPVDAGDVTPGSLKPIEAPKKPAMTKKK